VPTLRLLTPEQRDVKNDPARRAQARMESVPGNIREICQEYFGWKLEEFHLEALQLMFEGGYLVINWPTDHAKSTMGGFLFPLLSLMNNPNETHIICGANLNDSKRRVQALAREIETNEALIRDFPWLDKPDKDAPGARIWTSMQFNVSGRTINKPNPSVIAAAVGSNDIKGRRGKLIMDDIEGEDARWSPMKRAQLYSWLKLEAWRCYEDKHESLRPLLCLMGTPFDIDSIYFRAESQEWKVLRRSCYLDGGLMPDEPKFNSVGQPWNGAPRKYLWPAKKDKVEHARRRLRKLEFAVAYLMDPTGGDPSRVSSAELVKATQEAKAVEDYNVALVALDPASGGQGPRQDYAGVAVLRINWPIQEELPNVELQECHSFSQGLFEQVHMCADLSARYGYPVIYEVNSQQGGTYANCFAHLHPDITLLRHHTDQKSKFDTSMGLTVVKRLAVDRKLHIPLERMEDEGTVQFIQELRDLQPPFKTHNHISAAIWFAVRYAYEQVRYHAVMPIRTTYGERIQRPAGAYFGGRPAAVEQYRNFGHRSYSYREDILRKEMRKEQERFARQLQGRG
jgi:hypothetical protein